MAHRRSAYGPGVLALNTWTKQMGEGLQGFQVVCLSLGRSVHGTKTFRCSDLRDQSAFSHRQNLGSLLHRALGNGQDAEFRPAKDWPKAWCCRACTAI